MGVKIRRVVRGGKISFSQGRINIVFGPKFRPLQICVSVPICFSSLFFIFRAAIEQWILEDPNNPTWFRCVYSQVLILHHCARHSSDCLQIPTHTWSYLHLLFLIGRIFHHFLITYVRSPFLYLCTCFHTEGYCTCIHVPTGNSKMDSHTSVLSHKTDSHSTVLTRTHIGFLLA
jgi:hypothetical protein